MMLTEGLVQGEADQFLVQLKIAYFAFQRSGIRAWPLLLGLARHPMLMSREMMAFFKTTIRNRRKLIKYYFSP